MCSEIHNRGLRIRHGFLPHWEMDGGTYFVTFRLDDSLPDSVVRAYRIERENIIKTTAHLNRDLTEDESDRLRKLYSDRIESYLDAGSGACYLKKDAIAELVKNALFFFDGQRYKLAAWCIMPNHVHVVFRPFEGYLLEKILHSWKSFTANKANEMLSLKGYFWQKEYYDHLIRNGSEFVRMVEYVLDNPEKAGLQDWPWVGLCK